MIKKFILILLVLMLAGCGVGRHTGTIETFNAAGEPTGSYKATFDRSMEMKITAVDGTTVEANSKGESIFANIVNTVVAIATLGMVRNN